MSERVGIEIIGEFDELCKTRDKVFQALPIEWFEVQLGRLSKILENNISQSVQALRHVLVLSVCQETGI